jgi:hypothetical protein
VYRLNLDPVAEEQVNAVPEEALRPLRRGHQQRAGAAQDRGDGPVGRRLILDTNMLIAYERGTIDRRTILSRDAKARFADLPTVIAIEA